MRVSVEAIRERIGKRQGQRTDRLLDARPEVPAGTATREHAAKSGGFDSDHTYRQAKAVVERGAPELITAHGHGGAVDRSRRLQLLRESSYAVRVLSQGVVYELHF